MNRRGAIYARVSDPSDTRVASIDSQITSTRAKLEALGCTDIEIFIERYSGALFHERKELSRLRDGWGEQDAPNVLPAQGGGLSRIAP